MKRAPRHKPGQGRKSKPPGVEPSLKATANSQALDVPSPYLPNWLDNVVIRQLARPGNLAVDRFAEPNKVAELRAALIGVYRKAAQARKTSTATKAQLMNAKSALTRLTRAHENLAKVAPDGQVGLLRGLQGSPLDDKTGEREFNEFASACNTIRMDVALPAQALHLAIERAEQAQRSPASGPNGSERWSMLSLTGVNPADGRWPRPSKPIDAMVRLQSCMAVMENFSSSHSRYFVRWIILKSPRSRRPSQTCTKSGHVGATKIGRENTNLRVVQAAHTEVEQCYCRHVGMISSLWSLNDETGQIGVAFRRWEHGQDPGASPRAAKIAKTQRGAHSGRAIAAIIADRGRPATRRA